MTNDELIEVVLKILYEVKTAPLYDVLYRYFKDISADMNGFVETKDRIREIMYNEGLIGNAGEYSTITHLGKTIVENGGWLVRVERLNIIEKRKEDSIIWESELNRWNVKSRWWPHIFSGIGVVISVIALAVSLQKQPTEEQLMKLLLEQQKLLGRDYPTIQTKIDSLKNDSLNLKLKVDKQIKKK